MSMKDMEARLEAIEARLDVIEGKGAEETPKGPPPSKTNFIKRAENEFPKWVFMMVDGDLKTALIKTADELPEGAYESPEEARKAFEESADGVIPDDWKSLGAKELLKIARTLPDSEGIKTGEDARVVIELELERRENGQ